MKTDPDDKVTVFSLLPFVILKIRGETCGETSFGAKVAGMLLKGNRSDFLCSVWLFKMRHFPLHLPYFSDICLKYILLLAASTEANNCYSWLL